jgi:hypothetical protein
MKKRMKNNFKKIRFEDTQFNQNDYVIKSEPIIKEVNSLKMKYFYENSYDNIIINKDNNFLGNNNFANNFIPNININNYGNNLNKQFAENPYYAKEYKINNSSNMNMNNVNHLTQGINNNNFNYNNNFPQINMGNMNNFGNFNSINNNKIGNFNNNYNQQMNLSGLIKPMGVNPFSPPNNTNNDNTQKK